MKSFTCDICGITFKESPLDVDRRTCASCCEEIAYLLMTGKFKREVAEDRKLIN